ncbi:MAG: type II toxin-antitoxin system VapC family toxin [Bacteroidales bacterium]|nr:type II toxin-antitoxin system VapC family toxin [Bacteroidales bacterium]
MKHVFLDTNVLLDYAFKDRIYHEYALLIFRTAQSGKLATYTSTQSLLDFVYIYTKGNKLRVKEVGAFIQNLCNSLTVCDTLKHHLIMAASHYDDDFEDAVQTSIAIDHYCEVIISGDNHFDGSFGPPVVSPDEFCREFFEEYD